MVFASKIDGKWKGAVEMEGYEIIQKGEVINDDEIKITYEDDSGEKVVQLIVCKIIKPRSFFLY